MDFLGIGPLELFFVLIIALIVFGPNDIVKAGKSIGSFMRKVVTSDGWKAFQEARKGMSDLPATLMREAGLEENDLRELSGMADLQNATKDIENQIAPWTTPPLKLPDNPANPVEPAAETEPTAEDVSEPEAAPPPEEATSPNNEDDN